MIWESAFLPADRSSQARSPKLAMRDSHMAEVVTLHPVLRSWTIGSAASTLETHSSRGPMLGVLFDASCPPTWGGPPRLHSLRAAEAMNRAKNMCQLAMLLEHHRWNGSQHGVGYRAELSCANQLASS